MSLSECGGVCSSVLTSDDDHSLSAVVVLYADMRGEQGGDKGMMKFPSTIDTSTEGTKGECCVGFVTKLRTKAGVEECSLLVGSMWM